MSFFPVIVMCLKSRILKKQTNKKIAYLILPTRINLLIKNSKMLGVYLAYGQ